jgi:hypothetical protein
MERLGVRKKFEQQRVTRFVVSGVLLFFFAERRTSALLAPANFVARFLPVRRGVIPFNPRRAAAMPLR